MKKITRQILLVLSLTFLFSTTQNSFAVKVKNNEITEINGVVSGYSIVRTNYVKNSKDIEISFPQIKGLQDKTKQSKINKIIKDNALVDCQEDIALYDWYDLDYAITWSSNRVLSIIFTGNYYSKSAPHPNNSCYTVNIDINTGNRIFLPDFINADNDFVKLFINKAQFFNDYAGIDLTEDELSLLKEDKFNILNLKYNFDKDAEFYFTSTGIVFAIDTDHAIGDFSLFSLKFSELSNYIKNNTVWNNIKTDFLLTDYQIIRDQCFKTNLASFQNTWFVSGFNNSQNGVKKTFKFYLIDQNNKIKYAFPNLFSNNLGYLCIRAVSFMDVNNDGNKDVIIITLLNSTDGTEVDEAGVYLYNSNCFTFDNKLNTSINTKLNNTKTVSDVLKATKNYYKQYCIFD